MPDTQTTPTVMGAHRLRYALEAARSHRATDSVRPILTGLLVEHRGDHIVLVATDSFALAEVPVPIDEGGDPFDRFLVDAESVVALWALVKDCKRSGDWAHLSVTDEGVTVRVMDRGVILSCIVGEFPNYLALIPEESETWRGLTVGTSTVGFHPKLLERSMKSASAYVAGWRAENPAGKRGDGGDYRGDPSVEVRIVNDAKPTTFIVELHDEPTARFLVMPRKITHEAA